MRELPMRTSQASSRAMAAVLGLLVGTLLFGDYLTLTLSRLATGTPGNWIAFAGGMQPLVVLLTLLVGHTRDKVSLFLLGGYLGLCALAMGHAVPLWLEGNELPEYGDQKLGALFFLLGPALCCGILLGQREDLPGARTMPWFLAPLLMMCGIALATNPRLLTIEYFADPPVFFGFLVMPAHQPLAFVLTKAALLAFAAEQRANGSTTLLRTTRLLFVGAMLGLVLVTGARSYAAALAAALAAQSLLSGRRLGLLLVGTAVALLVFQGYATETVQERFDPTQMMESLAYREREQAWEAAWTAFCDNPLIGVGPGCFALASGWHGRVYPHNLPLELGAEFGVTGLCCFAAMLGVPVWHAIALLRHRRRPGTPALFAVGLLVFGFGGSLAVGDLIRNYFLMFAIGMSAATLRREHLAALAAGDDVPAEEPAAGAADAERQAEAAAPVAEPIGEPLVVAEACG